MKRNLITTAFMVVAFALASPAFSQTKDKAGKKAEQHSKAAASNKIEEEIMKLEKERAAARLRNDVAAYNRYLAEDFFSTGSNGIAREGGNKRTGDINVTPGSEKYESNDIDDLRVKVYDGDTAVVTYRRSVKARTKDGNLRDIQLREIIVWVKQNGEWKIVASQTTTIPPQPPK